MRTYAARSRPRQAEQVTQEDPEWQAALAALEQLVTLGWTFRTTVAQHSAEPDSVLAERAVGEWIDVILIEGHDRAHGMRYEAHPTQRRPQTEKLVRRVDGALDEVVDDVLGWSEFRG